MKKNDKLFRIKNIICYLKRVKNKELTDNIINHLQLVFDKTAKIVNIDDTSITLKISDASIYESGVWQLAFKPSIVNFKEMNISFISSNGKKSTNEHVTVKDNTIIWFKNYLNSPVNVSNNSNELVTKGICERIYVDGVLTNATTSSFIVPENIDSFHSNVDILEQHYIEQNMIEKHCNYGEKDYDLNVEIFYLFKNVAPIYFDSSKNSILNERNEYIIINEEDYEKLLNNQKLNKKRG